MSMSVKRYFIKDEQFDGTKVLYFFGIYKFCAYLLAYINKIHYLCRLFRNVRNVRVHTDTQKTYAKHQKYSNHRTR